jgi:hypothetical protein
MRKWVDASAKGCVVRISNFVSRRTAGRRLAIVGGQGWLLGVEQVVYGDLQCWQVVLEDVPDLVEIDAEVVVYEGIPA